ncbi:MAG: integration host factor subunit beta [Deltaproteobacteria bacterium]|jgi:integration host factor subunit beta|nr:integration host factor subunit beta [Deltaproteobacteria bacterium]
MTKRELIALVAAAEDITVKEAELAVKTVFGSIKRALQKEDRIEIRGFGSFKVKWYPGYQGRNPRTGDSIQVKGKKLPFFRAGKELKERVNQG